ncbi:MAG: PaaI family thioesterase [Deltaproteobacteria bacterium]|jgi:uncharacterized protein (TIGR00369 family)|nr:PaaI family thioesterase [Deltaproteobacteria bacterium]
MPGLDPDGIRRFLAERFPQALEWPLEIGPLVDDSVTIGLAVDDSHLRPGGTISGPVLMTLADTAMYFLLLAKLGPIALAVTTSLHIDFLRRPEPRPITAKAELLKLGRTLAVGRVTLALADDPRPVAHASVTYALPPEPPSPSR